MLLAWHTETQLTVITVAFANMGMSNTAISPQELFQQMIENRCDNVDALLVTDISKQGVNNRKDNLNYNQPSQSEIVVGL